ncbi:hypothetical protein HYR99_41020 [Candidatus Poribacteria bacterium]|nr:hypothetical protein [Candidatus Poribacteria bacterium]
METKEMEKGKVIGNVAVLDIRKATEESIASIRRVGNAATVLYSPETARFIPRLNMGNIANTIEVPGDAKLQMFTGQTILSQDAFKHQTTPAIWMVTGQVIVNPDIPAEDIVKSPCELIVTGQLICPEPLEGAIRSKLLHFTGQIQTYTPSSRLTMGNLLLDEHYLRSLDDGSELVVLGTLNLPQVLPNDLFTQKIQRIEVTSRITCREENAEILFARLDHKKGSPKVTTIPAGFQLVEKSLILDADLLEALPSRKLYCTDRVQIDKNVDSAALDKAIEALVVKEMVICPTALKGVIARKCNFLETQVVFYEGELWLVEGEETLLASRFDYLEGVATLMITGELTIAPDVDPKVLFERLAKVHNLGEIRCTPDQMSAIRARLGLKDGELIDSTQTPTEDDEEEDTGEGGIGNAAYLAL